MQRYVKYSDFVVMPNHVHGILILDNGVNNANTALRTLHAVETLHATSLRRPPSSSKIKFMSGFRFRHFAQKSEPLNSSFYIIFLE